MKLKPLAVVIVALAIGFGAGACFQLWRQRAADALLQIFPITHAASSSTRCVAVLRLLRAGDTERAVNTLETYLDGDLIGLGPTYEAATPEQRVTAWASQAIQMAREYRQAHPHNPDAAIAGAVSHTLSIPTP